jgi:plasmid stability protein
MAQLGVRNVQQSKKPRLRRRAERYGGSLEGKVRDILLRAVSEDEKPAVGLGTKLASMMQRSPHQV